MKKQWLTQTNKEQDSSFNTSIKFFQHRPYLVPIPAARIKMKNRKKTDSRQQRVPA